MTEREKLIEICQPILNLCNSNGCRLCLYEAYKPFCISTAIAETLLRNGVIVVDTNCVKRENLPLVQQAFNMPLDKLAEIVSAQK